MLHGPHAEGEVFLTETGHHGGQDPGGISTPIITRVTTTSMQRKKCFSLRLGTMMGRILGDINTNYNQSNNH